MAVELCNVIGVETGFRDWSAAGAWLLSVVGSAEATGTGLVAGDSSAAGDCSSLGEGFSAGLSPLFGLE